MPARCTLLHLAAKASMVLGGLFVMTVLLAAMPGHRPPIAQNPAPQESPASGSQDAQGTDHSQMPGMNMGDEQANEKAAVHDMTRGHHDASSLHLFMTSPRPQTQEDVQRANEILEQLRAGIEKYKDNHVALNEGYKIFLPNLPQPEYHFTNYLNGFSNPSLSITLVPLPCSTRRLPPAISLSAPCTPCPSALRTISSMRVCL
jgi:hypothetical protein